VLLAEPAKRSLLARAIGAPAEPFANPPLPAPQALVSTASRLDAGRDMASGDKGITVRRGLRAAAVAACAWVLVGAPSGWAQEAVASAPARGVEHLHEAMLGVMRRASELTYQQRFDLLAPAIEQAYDLDFMARKSLGRAFDGLDAASRRRWDAVFRTYTIASFAGRFHGYAGSRFETVDEEPSAQGTVLVRTRIVEPGADPVALNYRLREREGTWKIVDVYLKGTVSELALRRADFAATMDRQGFDALVASLEGKIADLAAGKIK
jgi:phospholipid transport system substrate-binding protein